MLTIKQSPKDIRDMIGIYTLSTGTEMILKELHLDDEGKAFTYICRKVNEDEVVMDRFYLTPSNYQQYLNDSADCLAIILNFTKEHL